MANILFELTSKIPVLRDIQKVYSERNALRQLYNRDNFSGGLVPGKYYQQIDHGSGNVKGFSAVCCCGKEHRILSLHECFAQDFKCPTCKMEVNLLKFLEVVDAEGRFKLGEDKKPITAQEVRARLSKLPVRPVAAVEQRTQFLGSDDFGGAEQLDNCSKVGGRNRAFEGNDPGAMGPGF